MTKRKANDGGIDGQIKLTTRDRALCLKQVHSLRVALQDLSSSFMGYLRHAKEAQCELIRTFLFLRNL